MEARLLARDAARQAVDWSLAATAATTAVARDLAYDFGYAHPEAGTCKAIQAVLDQLDNPLPLTNPAAWEKHGVGRGAFKRWKKHLVLDFPGTVVVDSTDSSLASALESRDARLAAPQGGQAVSLPPQFAAHAPSEPVVSGDMLADAAAASGVSLAEALDKLTLSAADRHAAAIVAEDKAEAEAVLREREAADAAQAAEAATVRARQAAALADSARARVAAAHLAVEAAAVEAADEATERNDAREAEQRQRAEAAASAAGSSSRDAPPPAKADGASSSAAGQTLTAGQRVCIHGVQTRTELNGAYGRVIAVITERSAVGTQSSSRGRESMSKRIEMAGSGLARWPQRRIASALARLQSGDPQSHGYSLLSCATLDQQDAGARLAAADEAAACRRGQRRPPMHPWGGGGRGGEVLGVLGG